MLLRLLIGGVFALLLIFLLSLYRYVTPASSGKCALTGIVAVLVAA